MISKLYDEKTFSMDGVSLISGAASCIFMHSLVLMSSLLSLKRCQNGISCHTSDV